jgi:AmmeMemoRadiSam system protein B
MNIRHPARAGQFYEASPSSCALHAGKLLDAVSPPEDLPDVLYGGLVPHAGWMYSGEVASLTLLALHSRRPLRRVVLLGADHTGSARAGEVYPNGVWRTPLGDAAVDEELAAALLEAGPELRANPRAHEMEHSIEVQVPLIQQLAPQCRIVPIMVPPTAAAAGIGELIGGVLAERFEGAVVVGSTDLTHHAGHFPAPGGRGAAGEQWSRQNDRRLLDLIESMSADSIVPEADERGNACGAGAIAATVAACRRMGATRGICLQYTNSYEVIRRIFPGETDDTTVGYASVVFA